MEFRRLVYDKNYNTLYVHEENCYDVWKNNIVINIIRKQSY